MSRLTTYTPAKHRLMLDALRAGCTVREACSHAGIAWPTWCEWRRRVRAGDRFNEGVASLVDEYEQAAGQGTASLVAQIKMHAAKDYRAAAYLVDRRDSLPERRERTAKLRAERKLAELRLAHGGVEKHEHAVTVDLTAARADLAAVLAGSAGASDPSGEDGSGSPSR